MGARPDRGQLTVLTGGLISLTVPLVIPHFVGPPAILFLRGHSLTLTSLFGVDL
jgi:hypothetical protein